MPERRPKVPEAGSEEPSPLRRAVQLARETNGFLAEIRKVYKSVDRRSSQRGARCLGGGACCKFDLAGHRLYLTPGELAILLESPPRGEVRPRRCPYQSRGLCTAYARRPLGCRAYYCGGGMADWCAATTEEHHRRLRRLHDRFAVPYAYVELGGALAEVLPPKK